MMSIKHSIRKLTNDEGQGLIEYGLILSFITLLFFTAYSNFGSNATSLIIRVSNSVSSVS